MRACALCTLPPSVGGNAVWFVFVVTAVGPLAPMCAAQRDVRAVINTDDTEGAGPPLFFLFSSCFFFFLVLVTSTDPV